MRLPIVATLAGAVFLTSCQQPVEFDPNDPETTAAIEAVLSEAMEGARNVDADRVLAAAEGEGELTLITGDVMLGGIDYIRETFRETYGGLERQDQTVLASQVKNWNGKLLRSLCRDGLLRLISREGTQQSWNYSDLIHLSTDQVITKPSVR